MIPVPVLVNELKFQGLKVIYQQYNTETRSTGTVTCTGISGVAKHMTNIPGENKEVPLHFVISKRFVYEPSAIDGGIQIQSF